MYRISNSQREELTRLLAALNQYPAKDIKALNIQRRAKIALTKLSRAQKITETHTTNLIERKETQ